MLLALLFKQFGERKIYKPTTGPTLTYILIDGLSQDVFESLEAEGKLPHLSSLMNEGHYIKNGIVSFPSMTGYGFYPYITGVKAQQSGILGLRWFDRSRSKGNLRNYVGRTNIHMNNDIDTTYKNIFELSRPFYSVSMNSYMNRGVSESKKFGWAHTTSKYENLFPFSLIRKLPIMGKLIVKSHFNHEELVSKEAIKQLKRNPKVQWITFAGPDAYNHINGTDSTYLELLIHIDGLIGEIKAAIQEYNQADTRHLFVVSDHGVADVDNNIDVREALEELNITRGVCTHLSTSKLEEPLESLSDCDGYFVINGDHAGFLYMAESMNSQSEERWRKSLSESELRSYTANQKTIDILSRLAQLQGVEFIAYMVNDSIIGLQNKLGRSQIKRRFNQYAYDLSQGDVLAYENLDSSFLNPQNFHSDSSWLDVTYSLKYPDAPNQLFEVLASPSRPDVIICSSERYDLAKDYEFLVHNFKGGHGGLRRDMMSVPIILYGPSVEHQQSEYMRSEDVGKLAFDVLGFKQNLSEE